MTVSTWQIKDDIDSFVLEFMSKHGLPGLSIAFGDNDRGLFLSRAYGNARYNQPCTTQTRFRIASTSKPITAVTIMHMQE